MSNYYARKQRGITLYIVIVMVLLSTLFALWASRSSLFNELIVGNDADYRRAFEAAEAVLQDAELDIRGQRPDGGDCVPDAAKTAVCRVGSTVWFPEEEPELGKLTSTLEAQTTGCLQGICNKRTANQDFWKNSTTLSAMIASGVGARYGQYTGVLTGAASNPILNQTADGSGAWYWVEFMPYTPTKANALLTNAGESILPLNLTPNVVYRITAIARGLKPNTQVVLQSTFARDKVKD